MIYKAKHKICSFRFEVSIFSHWFVLLLYLPGPIIHWVLVSLTSTFPLISASALIKATFTAFPKLCANCSGGFHVKHKTSGQIFWESPRINTFESFAYMAYESLERGSFFHKKSGDISIHSGITQNIDSKMLAWTNYSCPSISVKLQLGGWRFCIYCPQERDYIAQSKEKGNQFLQFEFQTLRELMGNRLWRTWVTAKLPTFRLNKRKGEGNSQRVSERVSTYVGTWKGDPGPSPFTSSVLSHDGERGNRNSRRFGGAKGICAFLVRWSPEKKNKTVNKMAKI